MKIQPTKVYCCDDYQDFLDARDHVIEVDYCAYCGAKIEYTMFNIYDIAIPTKGLPPSYGPFYRPTSSPVWKSFSGEEVSDKWVESRVKSNYYKIVRNGEIL